MVGAGDQGDLFDEWKGKEFRTWINVKDFSPPTPPGNALGDGTNDDTAAIQLAIDYAQAAATPDKRNAVYFPLGTYRITSELEVYRNQGIRLIGVGDVAGLPVYAGSYGNPPIRQTGAVLYWDGAPGGTLLRFKGSYDGTLENLTFVGATPQRYRFDDATGSSDPGEKEIRFNSGTFASVTEIYANIKNFYDVEIPDWLDGLDAGTAGRLTIQQRNSTSFAIFDVTGSVTGSGTWRTINVKPVQASGTGTFANNAELILSFVRNGGTPQRYLFQTSTDPSTGDGLLRFDNTTFTSITKIYVNHKSWNGFIVQDWLESIDDRADVRVTVCHITNRLIRRIFKVNSVTASGGTRIINVTPLYSAGTLSDSDPVVLVCSTPTPIRDRAGSLVTQESETGWPSGHMLIENCTFLEADDGVRLDETTPTNNCADNSFVQSNFINCSVGIKCNWIQVVNNTVINCDFSGCTVAIDHAYGGDLRVFGSSMNGYGGDVFLRVQRGGVNASSFLLNGIRLEMSAGKPSLLETIGTNEFDTINVLIDSFGWTGGYPEDWDDMTDYYIGNEVFYLGTVYRSLTGTQGNPNTGNPPLSSSVDSIGDWEWRGDWVRPVRLSQNTNCTIRGSIVKGPFANVVGSTAYATLRLDNCRLSYNETDVVTVGTNGVWKTIDCTGGQGAPLLDAGNWSVNEKPPTGTIAAFGGTTAPAGYLLCDGSAVSRTTYAALFTAIGTTYGVGDGSTTFNVPNLQQKFPLGKATAGTGSTLGGTGGNIDHTHTIDDYDADVTASVSGKTANTTGTHTHTMQGANPPFLVVNYIIKT